MTNECHINGCRYLQTTCVTCGKIVCTQTLPERQNWQPIATAPKDGTHILVFDKDECICVGYKSFYGFNHHPAGDFASGCPLFNVTAWMPLPDAPKESE